MNRLSVVVAILIIFAIGLLAAALAYRHQTSTVSSPPSTQFAAWDPMLPFNIAKRNRITAILENAPTSQPSTADANELLEEAAHDPSFAIRVRAMAALPFLREREKAIDVLIRCVHDRDPEVSGGGNVPLYATTYLADMNAARAIPDIEDWISFLESKPPYDEKMSTMILKKGNEDLARLKQSAATRPAE